LLGGDDGAEHTKVNEKGCDVLQQRRLNDRENGDSVANCSEKRNRGGHGSGKVRISSLAQLSSPDGTQKGDAGLVFDRKFPG